jgi:hypothetical protein
MKPGSLIFPVVGSLQSASSAGAGRPQTTWSCGLRANVSRWGIVTQANSTGQCKRAGLQRRVSHMRKTTCQNRSASAHARSFIVVLLRRTVAPQASVREFRSCPPARKDSLTAARCQQRERPLSVANPHGADLLEQPCSGDAATRQAVLVTHREVMDCAWVISAATTRSAIDAAL